MVIKDVVLFEINGCNNPSPTSFISNNMTRGKLATKLADAELGKIYEAKVNLIANFPTNHVTSL